MVGIMVLMGLVRHHVQQLLDSSQPADAGDLKVLYTVLVGEGTAAAHAPIAPTHHNHHCCHHRRRRHIHRCPPLPATAHHCPPLLTTIPTPPPHSTIPTPPQNKQTLMRANKLGTNGGFIPPEVS